MGGTDRYTAACGDEAAGKEIHHILFLKEEEAMYYWINRKTGRRENMDEIWEKYTGDFDDFDKWFAENYKSVLEKG